MSPGLALIIFISLISIIGCSCIIRSLFEKDITISIKKKPAQFYPQKIDPLDHKIESILNDDNFSLDDFSTVRLDEDNEKVVLDL